MHIFILDTVLCSLTMLFQQQNRHRMCLFYPSHILSSKMCIPVHATHLHLRIVFLTMQRCCNDRAPKQSMQYVFVLCQCSSPLIFVHSSFQWYVSAFLRFSTTYSRVPLTAVCQPGLVGRTFYPHFVGTSPDWGRWGIPK